MLLLMLVILAVLFGSENVLLWEWHVTIYCHNSYASVCHLL